MNKILLALTLIMTICLSSSPSWSSIISPKKIQRLTTFAHIASDVQYFHPSDAVEKTNWEAFLTYGMQQVAKSSDDNFESTLRNLFKDIAPTVKINGKSAADVDLSSQQVMIWNNTGYVDTTNNAVTSPFTHARHIIDITTLGTERLSYSTTYYDIKIDIPLALPLNAEGQTLPESSPYQDNAVLAKKNGLANPEICAASVSKVWGALQHFYPNFQATTIDWDAELKKLITACEKHSVKHVYRQMRLALSKFQDNQMQLNNHDEDFGLYTVPLGLTWLNNKAVVNYKESDQIQFGDELTHIDGVDLPSLIQQLKPYSLHSQQSNDNVLNYLMRRQLNTPVTLTLRDAEGNEYTLELNASQSITDNIQASHDNYTYASNSTLVELGDGYYYVNLAQVKEANIAPMLEKLEKAKGIVLDVRSQLSHDNTWQKLLSHFASEEVSGLPLIMHRQIFPNQQDVQLESLPHSILPEAPILSAPTVVLTSKYSAADNELALGYIQSIGLTIIGEKTYGGAGPLATVTVQTGLGADDFFKVSFTGLEVKQHDGSPMNAVGLTPDMLVTRTQEGIREQYDEQFEAAFAYLRNLIN